MTTSYVEEQRLRLETLQNDLSVFRQQREANPSAVPVSAEAPGPARVTIRHLPTASSSVVTQGLFFKQVRATNDPRI
jgi:hypothetical protein